MRFPIAIVLCASLLWGCGGGGSQTPGTTTPPVIKQQWIGEIYSQPSELFSSELKVTKGYAGNVATSRAIAGAGMENLLDLLFMAPTADGQGHPRSAVPLDAQAKLIRYATEQKDLLTPGIRVLISDEVFLVPGDTSDNLVGLERQLAALRTSITMVRQTLPQASIGITVSPYATFGKPNTADYVFKAIALVDWVATDPYWLGDPSAIQSLHEWTRTFHAKAKNANSKVETVLVMQAFKLANWDSETFNRFISEELIYADAFDGVLFFGWQFVSEIDIAAAGRNFQTTTKQLYRKYLK